jgi:hypothetical protein
MIYFSATSPVGHVAHLRLNKLNILHFRNIIFPQVSQFFILVIRAISYRKERNEPQWPQWPQRITKVHLRSLRHHGVCVGHVAHLRLKKLNILHFRNIIFPQVSRFFIF